MNSELNTKDYTKEWQTIKTNFSPSSLATVTDFPQAYCTTRSQ